MNNISDDVINVISPRRFILLPSNNLSLTNGKKVGNVTKKNIIVTSGPTNERIDAVMKITNMSTGALGVKIADELLKEDDLGKLYYLSPKLAYKPKTKSEKLELVQIESALDLLNALKDIITNNDIYGVVHSAAVGDYYGEYAITGEILASLIAKNIYNKELSIEELENTILEVIKNPDVITDNTHKISSYQDNLMVKLGLTPKVIKSIKEFNPNIKLIGFKLLDGVSKEELLRVASNLREKNNADYIVANDLSRVGNGKHYATIINEEGIYRECETKDEIAKSLRKILFK